MDIRIYQRKDGKMPFTIWMRNLRDKRASAKILIRLDRIMTGNFGDTKPVGDGISELRINEGKGYRVYYGRKGKEVVLLLCGGDKSSQQKAIQLAKKYWREYCE